MANLLRAAALLLLASAWSAQAQVGRYGDPVADPASVERFVELARFQGWASEDLLSRSERAHKGSRALIALGVASLTAGMVLVVHGSVQEAGMSRPLAGPGLRSGPLWIGGGSALAGGSVAVFALSRTEGNRAAALSLAARRLDRWDERWRAELLWGWRLGG